MADWIEKEKHDPYICCLKDSLQIQRHIQTENKGKGKIPHAHRSKKKVGVVILGQNRL